MKVCKLNTLCLLLAMPLLAVGPLGCPEEAGPVEDDGGKKTDDDEEEEEEEDQVLVAAGGVCQTNPTVDFSVGNCQEGLVCIPGLNEGWGTCRVDCSSLNADGQIAEDATVCTGGETCQTVMPNTYNKLTGQITEGMFAMVCMPQTTNTSSPCYGVYDEDSCTEDRDCQIAGYERTYNNDGSFQDMIFTDLRCRGTCDPSGEDDEAGTCADPEVCLWSQDPIAGYDVVWQGDDPETEDLAGEWIECSEDACDDDDDATECTCEADYRCLSTTDGSAHCGYFDKSGWCGTPVDLVTTSDWESAMTSGISEEIICDEVDDTRLCDDRPFRESGVDAELYCIGISSTSNQGICMAFCQIPADPADLTDEGFNGTCPTGMECATDLGTALIFGPWSDANGFVDEREDALTCDPVECPEGLECASCVHPGAQCGSVTLDQAGNTFNGCFMPYSFCQAEESDPVVEVSTDAGVPEDDSSADAGTGDNPGDGEPSDGEPSNP